MDELTKFVYQDTDSFQNEISELYLYTEEGEFLNNRNAFEESMEDCGLPLTWKHMVAEQKSKAINYLMTTLEVSCRTTRIKSCRALAYLVQGNFGECLSIKEQVTNCQDNVFLLYKQGLFQAFVQQLLIEIDLEQSQEPQQQQQQQQQHSNSSSNQGSNNLTELSLIMSVLCTITETMYHAMESTDTHKLELRNQFVAELQSQFGHELLSITLFQMLNKFCCGLAPNYPVRKITLLLWKVILITLGGTQTLKDLKDKSRVSSNLNPLLDDTIDVTKSMRPCSPPSEDGQSRSKAAFSGFNKRKVYKQPAFDEVVFAYAKECLLNSVAELNQPDTENENSDGEFLNELNVSLEFAQPDNDTNENPDSYDNEAIDAPIEESARSSSEASSSDSGVLTDSDSSSEKTTTDFAVPLNEEEMLQKEVEDPVHEPATADDPKDESAFDTNQPFENSNLKPETRENDGSRSDVTSIYKGLPWAPKVRKADLSLHLSNIRQKFLGYTLPNDLETVFGLPDPIVEGINVLKKHQYVSLAEIQLEREEVLEKYPLTHGEINPAFKDAAAEKLYCALLPRLPQYMIALLKILLAASTSLKNKSERTESINIMCELSLDEGNSSMIQTLRANTDANRHKEVIIKSVSAILLLLLKHFKINHIYQFEYISQQLMFANCIPLILKFLSQDIYSYIVSPGSNISAIDFPACVIGEQPELTIEAIALYFQPYSWRNMFSCINLLRILNKLTKWKHSRIMMLVVFKSAPTLTKALSVRHSMFQLYVLKLLKVQLKFLGRQWKKNNMKLISAIYQKVRHRLTDDWAYSNDNEAKPWDFQAEEFTLQANINKFHQRRYKHILSPNGKLSGPMFKQSTKFGTIDNGTDEDYEFGNDIANLISPQFEKNHERWLESEVFQRNIDWDKLLSD